MDADLWVWIAAIWAILTTVLTFAIRVVALGVIPGNSKPSTGVAWLLLVLLTPFLGIVAFWFFGTQRLGRRRAARQREAHERTKEEFRIADSADSLDLAPHVVSITRLAHRLGAMPIKSGNHIELLPDYRGTIAEMAAAIERAEHHVYAQFYIAARDEWTKPFFDAMDAAARRGVDVRFLFDFLGSRGLPSYPAMLAWLERSEVRYEAMLPLSVRRRRFRRPDLRNHRKLLVVDGTVGFMGSMNLTEPGYNKPKNHKAGRQWVELMCRVSGPVVAALEAVFAADWYTETEEVIEVVPPVPEPGGIAAQLLPSGPGFEAENNLRVFTSLIASANERLSITSPYFVPDESLLYTLTTAAMRGVEVELFVSEISDQFMVGHAQSSYYRALLETGVRIWRYPAPEILHSKHFTVDDQVAVIGSSNMDMRSFSLNYEISLLMLGPQIVAEMRQVEDHYRALSSELTLDEWLTRPRGARYLDNVFRLTAALQ